MKLQDLRGQTAVVGVGTFGCGEAHGYTEMELLAHSARMAVRDAGLSLQDIDQGVVLDADNRHGPAHFGIQLRMLPPK